jgi:hypothetical protein
MALSLNLNFVFCLCVYLFVCLFVCSLSSLSHALTVWIPERLPLGGLPGLSVKDLDLHNVVLMIPIIICFIITIIIIINIITITLYYYYYYYDLPNGIVSA